MSSCFHPSVREDHLWILLVSHNDRRPCCPGQGDIHPHFLREGGAQGEFSTWPCLGLLKLPPATERKAS